MLLRAYRITDRFGLLLLKTSSVALATLWQGLLAVLVALRRFLGGIVLLLLLVVTLVGTALGNILRFILRLFRGVSTLAVRGAMAGTRNASKRVTGGVGEAMARRTARAQIDVRIAEDPLRAQNRRLSVLVVLLGFVVIAVLLWATDPSRSTGTQVAQQLGGVDMLANATAEGTPIPEDNTNTFGLPTPIPVATQIPLALRGGGTLAYAVRERGQTDLWLVGVANRQPIRVTNNASDERDPAWSHDGTRLAYASHRDGNWELYIYELATQENTRITYDLSFQGNPKWSPDGLFLTFESYQGDNLDIYAVPVDGSAAATRVTDSPLPDYAPSWSSDGRKITFVSLRDGNQDLYVFNLDTLETTNITNTPLRDENNPSWSRNDSQLAFSAWENGSEKVYLHTITTGESTALNFGRTPSWSPDGASLTFAVDSVSGTETYLYAAAQGQGGLPTEVLTVPFGATDPTWSEQTIPPVLVNSGGLPLGVADDLFVEQATVKTSGAPYGLNTLLDVSAPSPVLSDQVNDSFNALRVRVRAESELDFLGSLDDAFWDLERLPNPGEDRRSWHMTGRGVAFARNALLGFPPTIEIVREQIGISTYWRIFLRVNDDNQSGQIGEPLRQLPWDFLSAEGSDVEAFNQGGRYRSDVPTGYYIDITQLALDYGWGRLPAGDDWRANFAARNYWLMVKQENLSWCDAMLEIYTAGEMVNFCSQGA